jgi:hypothetical protein
MKIFIQTTIFMMAFSVVQLSWAQDKEIKENKEDLLEQIERLRNEIELRELEMQRDELLRAKPPARRMIELQNPLSEQNGTYLMQSLMMRQPQGIQIVGGSEDLSMIEIMGPEELLDEAEEMIRRYDVPTPNSAELFFYLIRASKMSDENEFPEKIQNVIAELQKTFTYKSYTVMDVSMLRMGKDSDGKLNGNLDSTGERIEEGSYAIYVSPIRFRHLQNNPIIDISQFQFSFEGITMRPTEVKSDKWIDGHPRTKQLVAKPIQAELSTSFSIRGGQSIVLGKLNAEGNSDAFFVVVTANILD